MKKKKSAAAVSVKKYLNIIDASSNNAHDLLPNIQYTKKPNTVMNNYEKKRPC